MIPSLMEWFLENKIETLGTVLGILYIFLSIRQNIFTWPTGILTSILYIIVFYKSAIYAGMGLQMYYVIISIYGWYYWLKGKNPENKAKVPVRKTEKKLWLKLVISIVLIFTIIYYILLNHSNSDVPFLDSFTTSLSIVATWMLAKKYIENWLIWIFTDIVSTGLFTYKNLWPTVILYSVYTIMAVAGYYEWKKDLKTEN